MHNSKKYLLIMMGTLELPYLSPGSQLHLVRSPLGHVLCHTCNVFNMIWIKFICPLHWVPSQDP